MTEPDRSPTTPESVKGERPAAILVLQIFIWLLTLLPAHLVISPFGAFGAPASLAGLSAFALWAISGSARPALLARKVRPVRFALLALWIPGLISYAVMHFHSTPGDELNSADRWLLFMLTWSGVALLAAEGLRDLSDVMRVLRVAVAGVAAAAAIAVFQARLNYDVTDLIARMPGLRVNGELASVLERDGRARAGGTATHPLELGTVLAMTLGPALALAAYDTGWSRWRRVTAACLIALALPGTLSRSATVSAFVVIVFWFVGADRQRRVRGAALGMTFLTAFVVVTPGLVGAMRGLFANVGSDTSISTRTDDYAAVAPYIRNSPWIGRGPATFLPRFRVLDNQWLGSLIEVGLIGAAGLLLSFLTLAWLGSSLRHSSSNDPGRRALGAALMGTSAVEIWSCSTYDFMGFQMSAGLAAMFLGLAGGLYATVRSADAAGSVELIDASSRP